MKTREKLIFGTRGSLLARVQTEAIIAELQALHPNLECEMRVIRTRGDEILNQPLAKIEGKGLFVKEIEKALLAGEIDIAVHSLKDLPTEQPEGLSVAAIPRREIPWDVLYSTNGWTPAELPQGAKVGTSSLRRAAQLKRLRPDLQIADIRGNVDTRLRKVKQGEYDATILAAAGLARLQLLTPQMQRFTPEEMLPAPAQGALAIEVHMENRRALEPVSRLHHPESAAAVIAEREVLHRLGSGCAVPLAAFAEVAGDRLHLRARVIHPDGEPMLEAELSGSRQEAKAIGREVADRLIAQGALALIETAEIS